MLTKSQIGHLSPPHQSRLPLYLQPPVHSMELATSSIVDYSVTLTWRRLTMTIRRVGYEEHGHSLITPIWAFRSPMSSYEKDHPPRLPPRWVLPLVEQIVLGIPQSSLELKRLATSTCFVWSWFQQLKPTSNSYCSVY